MVMWYPKFCLQKGDLRFAEGQCLWKNQIDGEEMVLLGDRKGRKRGNKRIKLRRLAISLFFLTY
jgi:hypothetical protein